METPELTKMYASVSQRVVLSYLRGLADGVVMPDGLGPEEQAQMEASERALQGFFRAWYEAMYEDPARFGLPLTEDVAIPDDHSITQPARQGIIKKINKVRETIDLALGLLMTFGKDGQPEGQSLVLSLGEDKALEKVLKSLKNFLLGLDGLGLTVQKTPVSLVLIGPMVAEVLPALRALAQSSGRVEDPVLSKLYFARCDFGVLRAGYTVQPLDLYRVFNAADFAWVADLHQFFSQLGYKTTLAIHDNATWVMKYQGNRQIKASPLFQVEFQDRYQRPARVNIKCASANRITPIIDQQPEALQADFFRRTNRCNAPNCHWCKDKKGLKPSQLVYQGERKTVCWFVNSDVQELTDETREVIRAYALMHETLK